MRIISNKIKKDRKKLLIKIIREIAGQSNAEKSDEKELDEERKLIEFKCSICNLAEICHYFGKCPPFARGQIEYVDDSFVMMDPFTPRDKGDLWIYETNNKLQSKTSFFFKSFDTIFQVDLIFLQLVVFVTNVTTKFV